MCQDKISKNADSINGLYTLLPTVIKQIDTWIESSEMTAETFRKAGLHKEAQTFVDYAQAYWNVKQFIEVNGG